MKFLVLGFLLLFIFCFGASAETVEERIKKLEEAIQKQQDVLKEQQKALDDLKEQSKQAKSAEPQPAPPTPPRDYRLDDKSRGIYVQSASPLTPYSLTKQVATPGLMNPAISLILDTLYYHSSLSKDELESRSTPGFLGPQAPPFREGFNLRSAEMALFAPIDPYFNLYATIPFTEDGYRPGGGLFRDHFPPCGAAV